MSPSLAVGQRYVLVVVDDPALRDLYRESLGNAGFDSVAVEDGLSALRCVEAAKPLVLVLDLDAPRLGGLDVQQELKGHPDTKHIPIVVVSGNGISRVNLPDVACILRKPVGADELIAAVQRCLGRTHRRAGGLRSLFRFRRAHRTRRSNS